MTTATSSSKRSHSSRPTLASDDNGSITIEAAISSAALIILTSLLIAGCATLAAHIAAIDTAHSTARALAIGETPPQGRIRTHTEIHDGWVTVHAHAPAPPPFPDQHATAVFPQENLPTVTTL